MEWSRYFRANGKTAFKGTTACTSLFQGSFKGRWPSGDNLFCLQSQFCSFLLHGVAEYVAEFVISDLLLAWPPLKQLWLFLARKRSLLGLCQAEEPAPPPFPFRVRLVMHPLWKELLEDVICNVWEGIRLFLEYTGRVLLCSSAPPTDIFLSQVHVHGGVPFSELTGTGFLEVINNTLLVWN